MRQFSRHYRRRAGSAAAALLMGATVALAAPGIASATPPPSAPQGSATVSGHGDGTFLKVDAIPGAMDKVKHELATGQITQQEADGIPVSTTYVVTAKGFGKGEVGDPTVTAKIYENSIVNIPLWTFQVTQSFNDNGRTVTWISPVSWSGTAVHYIWWSINNEGSSTSSPSTGVWHTQTYANAVFNYCAYWVLCSETSYAEAWLNFYGNGYWAWNADYYNSF